MAAEEFSVRELAAALEHATDAIKDEVSRLLRQAAERTADRVRAAYPRRTGVLQGRVRATAGTSRRSLSVDGQGRQLCYVSRSWAPHVHFWEAGTRLRFDNTRQNAARGRLEPHPTFIPIAIQERSVMLAQAANLLTRNQELV